MKRSRFIKASIGAVTIAALPQIRRLADSRTIESSRRLALGAIGAGAGRCHAHRTSTRWMGYSLAEAIGSSPLEMNG